MCCSRSPPISSRLAPACSRLLIGQSAEDETVETVTTSTKSISAAAKAKWICSEVVLAASESGLCLLGFKHHSHSNITTVALIWCDCLERFQKPFVLFFLLKLPSGGEISNKSPHHKPSQPPHRDPSLDLTLQCFANPCMKLF